MSRQPVPFVNRWLSISLAVALVCATSFSTPAWADEASADDILSQSQKAMQPPIQYRIHSSTGDMFVSQKIMPDGTIAIRTETKKPIPKITLKHGNEYYDVYPTHGIAVDTQFMFQGAKAETATLAATLKGVPPNTAKIKGMVVREGRECYEIETATPSEALTALRKSLPEKFRNILPTGNRFIVDKETLLMVEMEMLTDASSPTMKMEYKDIVLKPDLADDMFLLPVGVEVRRPKTIREVAAVVAEIHRAELEALHPLPTERPFVPLPYDPPKPRPFVLGPIKFDEKGRAIPPVPPGMTQLEFNVLTAPPQRPVKMPPNHSWFTWVLIVSPMFIVLTILGVMRWKAIRSARLLTK